MLARTIILLVIGFVCHRLSGPAIIKLMQANALVRTNYLGKEIITAAGLTIFSSLLVSLFLVSAIFPEQQLPWLFFFGCTLITMVGLLDDLWGSHKVKGLQGHLRSLSKGELTTGGIKALTGLVLAFLTSRYFSQGYFSLAVNTFLLALTINALNLLDLRPGRTIKVCLLGFLLLFWQYGLQLEQGWMLVMVGALLSYAPLDFRGKVMLGDTGSNLLGFALGYSLVALTPLNTKVLLLILLVLLHWYSERHSLTELIARVHILDFFDRLGRPEV